MHSNKTIPMMKRGWLLSLASFIIVLASVNQCLALSASDLPIPTQIPDLEEQVDGTMTPAYPKAGESVKISLEAYGTDLNNASVTWTVDGKELESGRGQRTITQIAPKSGQTLTVVATINPKNGRPITKTFYINPQNVDIVWEANTYTPPFYRGKSMYIPEQSIKVVAMPNILDQDGTLVSPKSVVYKWRQDNTVLGDNSGYGNQSISYKGDVLALPVKFDVEASIENGNTAEDYKYISPTNPEINVYENSPLYGVLWNREVSSGFNFGDSSERSIVAIPYFFGVSGLINQDLSYNWSINGSRINVPTTQREMVFRNSENLEGQSRIGITVTNNNGLSENASSGTTIDFKKTSKNISL